MKRILATMTSSGLALATMAGPIAAAPVLDYTIGVGLQHDDNVAQSQDHPVSDNILAPNLSFTLNQQGSALTARAAGSVEYRDYLSGTFNSQFAGLLSSSAAWHISPDRLDWVAEDYVGRQPINVLANNDPNNQQQTNVFSTGPTLRAHFSDALRGEFDLRYTNTYAEVTKEFNGDRYGVAGRLLYQLDPLNQLTGNVSLLRARFDVAPTINDYDRGDVYVGYSRRGDIFDLQGTLGYSRLNFRDGVANHSGPLVQAAVSYTPNPTNALTLGVADMYSDAAAELSLDPSQIGQQVVVGSGLNGVVISPSVYRQRSLRLSFAHRADRYRYSVTPYVRKLHYLNLASSDQRAHGVYADFVWQLTARNALTVFAGGENRTYETLNRYNHDRTYGANLAWQQTRHWLWTLSFLRLTRGTNAAEQSYHENVIGISLGYRR